jgi:putative phosphoesterase
LKIAIISDIHANFDALAAFPENYDELWVLGDLVHYGPEPVEVIDWIMKRAAVCVRGNHDHSLVSESKPLWASRWREASEASRRFAASILSEAHLAFIRNMPLQTTVVRNGVSFYLTHATPSNPLHGYQPLDSAGWLPELEIAGSDVLLVGHSHVPFIKRIGEHVVLNPGSIGQPRNGDSRASYAIWEEGCFSLKNYSYPIAATIGKIQDLAFSREVVADLASILQTGRT